MEEFVQYSARVADFDEQNVAGYHLCLGLYNDSCSVGVFDPVDDRCMVLERYRFEGCDNMPELLGKLVSVAKSNELLGNENWKALTVAVTEPAFTFVPSEWMDDDEQKALMGLTFDYRSDLYDLHTFAHDDLGATCLYAIEKEVGKWMDHRYPSARKRYLNSASAFAAGISCYEPAGQEGTVCALSHSDMTTFASYEGGRLRFINTFETRNDDEFLYYLFLSINESGLEAESSRLLVWGDLMGETALFLRLRKYLREVLPGKRVKNVKFDHTFLTVPFQQGFGLSNAYLLTR